MNWRIAPGRFVTASGQVVLGQRLLEEDAGTTVLRMNMPVTIGSSDIGELAQNPQLIPRATNTASVLSGTGAFIAPITIWQTIAAEIAQVSPEAAERLRQIGDALAEEEALELMTVLHPEHTGVENTLWYIPTKAHGPRIKIAIDPARAKRRGGVEATVPFDAPSIGLNSERLEKQVRAFIDLNRDALMAYWFDDRVDTKTFLDQIKPI
jgi:hypothetical protein